MKLLSALLLTLFTAVFPCSSLGSAVDNAANALLLEPLLSKPPAIVHIPYMERPSLHRVYADALLEQALDASVDKFGPYKIVQQTKETVIEQQLEKITDNTLSVAVAMPNAAWLKKANYVPFPIMKGLASYRLFFVMYQNKPKVEKVNTLTDLKRLSIGQGNGWSTASILEQHRFKVAYGLDYSSLFPMLASNRFDLLMRGVYEMEVELFANKVKYPGLSIADNVAIYTYLPMYFFVSKAEPELAERLEYGLKKLHKIGRFDQLFQEHFWSSIKLLDVSTRKVFELSNGNIDASFYANDKPYLLNFVQP